MDVEKHKNEGMCRFSSSRIHAVALCTSLLGITLMVIVALSSSVSDVALSGVSQRLRHSEWQGSRSLQRRLISAQCQNQTCGNLSIPYPFGLSPECARDKSFELECKNTLGINSSGGSEMGLWPFLTNVAVGDAVGTQWNVSNQTEFAYYYSSSSFQVLNITANLLVIDTTDIKAMYCFGTAGTASIRLPDDGPYRLSDNNILTAVGCGAQVSHTTDKDGSGSEGSCGPNSCNNQGYYEFCGAYDCCTMSIEPSAGISLTGGGKAFEFYSTCGYGSLLLPDSFRTAFGGHFGRWTYGTELLWALPVMNGTLNNTLCNVPPASLMNSPNYACTPNLAKCNYVSKSNLTGYYCACNGGYAGDGYKNGSGCTDIDECLDESLNECDSGAKCVNLQGSYLCECEGSAHGDAYRNGTGCTGGHNTVLIASLTSVSGALLVTILVALCLCFYHRKQMKNRPIDPTLARMEVLHEMQIKGGAKICKIFSLEELARATDDFGAHKVIGEGGFGKVYRGSLDDGTEVAIKKAKRDVAGGHDDAKQFINEVTILSSVNHHNLVKLLGCSLETVVPILVYEYIPNGSLLDYFKQSRLSSNPEANGLLTMVLDWDQRLKIAIGTATALSYLHSGTSPPIYHRDVKSANILLDKKYVAKVADFGLSKLVPADDEETHLSTAVQGTPGYLDPQYFETYQITEKSDVYSFGVVLLELLTAEKVLDSSRPGQDQNLVQRCRRHLKFVAMDCCERLNENRPSMKQIEDKLRMLRSSNNPQSPRRSYTSDSTDRFRPRQGYGGYDSQSRETWNSTPITSRGFTDSEGPQRGPQGPRRTFDGLDSTPFTSREFTNSENPTQNFFNSTSDSTPITSREFTQSEDARYNSVAASSSSDSAGPHSRLVELTPSRLKQKFVQRNN